MMHQYEKRAQPHASHSDRYHFQLSQAQDVNRVALENYVARQYFACHKAHLSSFLPQLLSMSQCSEVQAVAGLQPASDNPLFLEQYLDQNIEQMIAGVINQPIDRSSIVEIGNLVSTRAGGSQLLFIILAFAIKRAGFHWLVFTATGQVNKLVKRLCASPVFLANATAERLGTTAGQWGEYYQKTPNVMAINLEEALANVSGNETVNCITMRYSDDIETLATSLKQHSIQHG